MTKRIIISVVFCLWLVGNPTKAQEGATVPRIRIQWENTEQPTTDEVTSIPDILYTNLTGIQCTNAYTVLRLHADEDNGRLTVNNSEAGGETLILVERRDVTLSATSGVVNNSVANFMIPTFNSKSGKPLSGNGMVTFIVYMPTNSVHATTNNSVKISNTLSIKYTFDNTGTKPTNSASQKAGDVKKP